MARIYQPTEYGSQYQGSAKEKGFDPVQALDQSKAIKERARQKLENIQNLARSSEIQGNLDRATVQGNQVITKAKFDGKWNAVQGFLKLSQAGIKLYETLEDDKKQKQKEAATLDSLGWGVDPVDNTEIIKNNNDDNQLVQSESKAINETSSELLNEGGVENAGISNQLQESSTYNLTKNVKSDVFSARGIHQAYLAERFREIPDDKKPRTLAEAQILVRQFNRDFFKETGLLDERFKDLILEELAPTMNANSANFITNAVNAGIKADQSANLNEAQSFVSITLDTNKDAQEIWTLISERYAFGNVGFEGFSEASNAAALEQILKEASEMGADGRTLITELRNVLQRKGVKGTELEKKFDHLFDKYEDEVDTKAIQDFNRNEGLAKIKNKKIVDEYYKNPSFDNKKKAIKALKEIGTEESTLLANKLLQTGFGYDPNKATELLELQAKGEEIDPVVLTNLLDEQIISQEEYNQIKEGGPYRASKKLIDTELDKLDPTFEAALLKGIPQPELTAEMEMQAGIRMISLKADIKNAVLAEVKVKPGLVNDKFELAKTIQEKTDYFLKQPQYQADVSPKDGLIFPNKFNTAAPYNVVGKKGVQDFSQLTYTQLFDERSDISRAEIDATKDYILTKNELKVASERFLLDGTFSENLVKFANELGLGPRAFLNSQLKVRLGKNIKDLVKLNNSEPIEYTFNTAENTFKFLVSESGLPFNGAGFLAANFEANNKLNQRGKNGVISYAPWQNSPSRLVAIEKHFGKKASEITNTEQLSYMIKEMKEQFPDVYKVFMNPNATNSALIAASAQYFGTMKGTTLNRANVLVGNPQ